MLKTYDTVILGCGEAGVFAGYELIHRNPGMKVLIVDQGQDIYHRSCPIVAGKVKLHRLQGLPHHVRLRRCGRFLRRQV